MLLAVVPAIFCRSHSVSVDTSTPHRNETLGAVIKELLQGIAITLRCRPFQQICIATFFIFNAYNTVAGFAWFIIVYYMNQGDPALAGVWPTLFGTVSALCTCFLVIPTINWMAQRYGKRTTFMVTQSISILGYLLFWWSFNPNNPYLMFVPIPIFAFGIGGLFTLMMSMTADICDLDELQTGERREGLFGAIYWWMVKFGLAFAGLLSGFILGFIGFDQNIAIQTDETLAQLRVAFIGVPVIGTLIALWAMRDYELDEAAVENIKSQLTTQRAGVKPEPETQSRSTSDFALQN
jgi:GPH family glycoside/pentoside/hexuronide:cation symporter